MSNGDDPRISAYILNELNESERRAFESELAVNIELRGELEAMSLAAGMLQTALKQESARVTLAPQRRAVIEDYVKRRTESTRTWTPRRRRLVYAVGAMAAMVLCVLTLWTLRSARHNEQNVNRRSAALLLSRLSEALKAYQSDFGALPPDTGFGLSMSDKSKGAGNTYDAGSLWRYLGCSIKCNGVTRGPYLNFTSSELAAYNDPVHGPSFYVIDTWGTPVGYVGSPSRVIHNPGRFDLFSAGPDRKTGYASDTTNLAYDGLDNNGDGVVDNSEELGGAAMNGCFTVANADVNISSDALDDLNNWDQKN